jgi:hypothetical protein
MPASTFPRDVVAAFERAKIIGVRAGEHHRYTGVWVVVVERRPFVRSWNDKPTGWFRAFRREPIGSVQLEGREVPVRGSVVRSARLREAVSAEYAAKYDTPGSKTWVTGFRTAARMEATLELQPAPSRRATRSDSPGPRKGTTPRTRSR